MNDQFNDNNNFESNPWQNPYENNQNTYQQGPFSEDTGYKYNNEARYPRDDFDREKYYEKRSKDKNKLKIAFASLAVVTSLSIVGLCAYIGYNSFYKRSPNANNNPLITSSQSNTNPNAEKLFLNELKGDETGFSAQEIYKKMVKSTVGIVMYDSSSSLIEKPKGQGTGVIVSSDGYIVTNSHVVGNSKDSKLKIIINEEEISGEVVGFDMRTDLAVVKVDRKDLTPAEFGDSDQFEVGATVFAIGNPLGMDFSNSFTRGIVSGVNRALDSSHLVDYIQTDATINPGNSGGPLIDSYGRVIGINNAKIVSEGFEGMGFSIPSKTAKSVIDDIIKQGYVSGRAYLGIFAREISSFDSSFYRVPQGILITDVIKGSDSEAKGLQAGDIITQINGSPVSTPKALMNEVALHSPGDAVTLTIYRSQSYRSFSSRTSTFDVTVNLSEDNGQTQDKKASDLDIVV